MAERTRPNTTRETLETGKPLAGQQAVGQVRPGSGMSARAATGISTGDLSPFGSRIGGINPAYHAVATATGHPI